MSKIKLSDVVLDCILIDNFNQHKYDNKQINIQKNKYSNQKLLKIIDE